MKKEACIKISKVQTTEEEVSLFLPEKDQRVRDKDFDVSPSDDMKQDVNTNDSPSTPKEDKELSKDIKMADISWSLEKIRKAMFNITFYEGADPAKISFRIAFEDKILEYLDSSFELLYEMYGLLTPFDYGYGLLCRKYVTMLADVVEAWYGPQIFFDLAGDDYLRHNTYEYLMSKIETYENYFTDGFIPFKRSL
jgi:hypothetical protein